jgi:hypothetical protein
MIENVIGTLIVGIITVVVIIAYRHPSGYKKIYLPLQISLLSILTILMVWEMAVQRAGVAVVQHLNIEGDPQAELTVISQVEQAIQSVRPCKYTGVIPLLWALASAFLYALSHLPSIITDQDKDAKPKE